MIYPFKKSKDIRDCYFCSISYQDQDDVETFHLLKTKFNNIETRGEVSRNIVRFTFTEPAEEAFFQLFYNPETNTYDVDL
jgi:hypothetical protein